MKMQYGRGAQFTRGSLSRACLYSRGSVCPRTRLSGAVRIGTLAGKKGARTFENVMHLGRFDFSCENRELSRSSPRTCESERERDRAFYFAPVVKRASNATFYFAAFSASVVGPSAGERTRSSLCDNIINDERCRRVPRRHIRTDIRAREFL